MGQEVHKGRGYSLAREIGDEGRMNTDFEVVCGCGATERIHANPQMNPDGVVVIFRRKGWHVHDSNPAHNKCPDCVNARGKRRVSKEVPDMTGAKVANQNQATLGSSTTGRPAAELANTVRPATPLESRRTFAELDECFIEGEGRYRPGYSDRTVGPKLNIPWATVQHLREESGLKIKGDPELLAIKADFQAVESMVAEIGKRLMAYESRVNKQ